MDIAIKYILILQHYDKYYKINELNDKLDGNIK